MELTEERLTEQQIITRILSGETFLYAQLISKCNTSLYKTGRAYGFAHEDVQDLMQESYVDAFRNLSKFGGRSSFRTWIIRIMLNHCYHKKQKHQRNIITSITALTETDNLMGQQSMNNERGFVQKELGIVMEKALKHLPDDYRMIFTLRELNGLNVSESAEVLEITESNVKVRLNRAKKMLRTEIEKMYTAEDIYEFNAVYCNAMTERVMKLIC